MDIRGHPWTKNEFMPGRDRWGESESIGGARNTRTSGVSGGPAMGNGKRTAEYAEYAEGDPQAGIRLRGTGGGRLRLAGRFFRAVGVRRMGVRDGPWQVRAIQRRRAGRDETIFSVFTGEIIGRGVGHPWSRVENNLKKILGQ